MADSTLTLSSSVLNSVPKLKGEENFADWKFALSLILRRQGKLDVVTGAKAKPARPAEALADWKKIAEDALTDIGLTIDPSQYCHIRDAADGHEAYTALAAIYEKPSRANHISIKRSLYGYIHDTSKPIQDYITSITSLASRLDAINCGLTATDITDVLIFNLDPSYSAIAGTLAASKEEFKVSEVSGMLLDEEKRKQGMDGNAERGGEAMVAYGRMGQSNTRRGTVTCYRCQETGHLAKDCTAPAPIPMNANFAQHQPMALTASMQLQEEFVPSNINFTY